MQKKTLDLVGIGECLVEFAETSHHVYKQNYSGDVLNALWMGSLLGLETGLISSVGDDPFTSGLMDVLREGRIDTAVLSSSSRPNGIYYVLDGEGQKQFHFMRRGSAATQTFSDDTDRLVSYIKRSRAVLFSAIPLAILKSREAMLGVLREVCATTTVYFDTNVRAALWPDLSELRTLIEGLASIVSVIFVSEEDDAILFGKRSPEVSLTHFEEMAYRTVILRRGAAPTLVRSEGRTLEITAVADVVVADATGAGDAFNAGFIAAQIEGKDLEHSVAFANAAAASVLGIAGGRAAGVTRNEVERLASGLLREAHA